MSLTIRGPSTGLFTRTFGKTTREALAAAALVRSAVERLQEVGGRADIPKVCSLVRRHIK
jgi:hypothetical protein